MRAECLAYEAHHSDPRSSRTQTFRPHRSFKMLELKHLDTKVMVYMTLLQGRVVFEAVQ